MLAVEMMPEEPLASRLVSHVYEKPDADSILALSGKRAVIVEDEGVTQLQLRKILTSQGIDVVGLATNGRDAVDLVLRTKPDLVLMDIFMPIMDGLEACRLILKTYSVCIVMLTAFSEEEYQQEAKEIGAAGYVLKPVTSDTLMPQIALAFQNFSRH
jgi:AmiR/NasT family two-component response regulator